MKMDRKKLTIIIACAAVAVVAIVLGILRPWEGPASAQTYTLTTAVNPPGTGLVSPSGRQYESGVQVTVTATPAGGYTFDHWSGDASDTSPTISITMDQDYSITANFVAASADQYDLIISSTEGGSVTTPGEGTFTYSFGTVVNLVATPASGYQFVNWTGGAGAVGNVNAASTTITVNGDYSVRANFAVIPPGQYSLTISSTAGGSVTTPGEGTFTRAAGAVVDLVATPASGYQFVNWTGDVSTVGSVNAALTPITLNGDCSITANFDTVQSDTEIADPDSDVGLPNNAPHGASSGWDITGLELTYDEATDTMRVRINARTILGDADGDGEPGATSAWVAANGGVDVPNLGSSETAAVFFDLDEDGDYDVIAGISGSTDYYGFSVNVFSGSFCPPYNFGTPLPANTGSISPNPSPTNPDLEFTIVNWSALPGHDGSPGFCVGAFLGSQQDDGIGEDFVYACI
jgi:uncharacterized repeat protein (TIGR02543 family)